MSQDHIFLIITGMHRSGTSCLAGCLQSNGVYLGDVIEWAPYNLKGNRENKNIMSLNESILEVNGGSWDKPPKKIQWTSKEETEKNIIIEHLNRKNINIYGFKDPRAIYTLPFWQHGINNLKLIASFRHPLLVAKSLENRDKIPLDKGLELWKTYNLKLLSYLEKSEFPIISFDLSKDEYMKTLKRIFKYLNITNDSNIDLSFYDETLKHQELSRQTDDLPDDIDNIYNELTQIYLEQAK